MHSALRQRMTMEEFLAWEERQELRWEFDGFQPVAMTGGTEAHSLIQSNLIAALGNRLRGSPCRVHGSHLKIKASSSIRYPDAFVICGPVQRNSTVAATPVVVFEIISPGTSGTDRILKAREYGDTTSIQRYVILEQTRQAATVFARDTGLWAGLVVTGNVDLPMPEIGIGLPLAELYLDVPLPPENEAE